MNLKTLHIALLFLLMTIIGGGLSMAKDRKQKKIKTPKLQQHVNSETMSIALVSTINEFQFGADTLIKTLAEKYSRDEEKLTAIAWSYSRFKRSAETLEKAYIYINKALEVNPRYVPALLLCGEVHKTFLETDSMIHYYKRAIAAAPQNPAGYLKMAEVETERGNTREANGYYATAKTLGMAPQDWVQYLTGLFMTGEVDRTAIEADTAIMLYPEEKYLYRNKFYALAESKRDSAALVAGDTILKAVREHALDSLNAMDVYYLGEVNLRQGRDQEAMTFFQQLYPKASTTLGYSLLKRMLATRDTFVDSLKTLKQHDRAAALYNRFIDIKPERRASDYLLLANIFIDKASALAADTLYDDEARKAMKTAAWLQADSIYRRLPSLVSEYDEGDLSYRRGQALYIAGEQSLAKPEFQNVVNLYRGTDDATEQQKLGVAYYYLTWISYNNGDNNAAYQNAREALKYRPDDSNMQQFVDYFGPKKKR